MRTAVDSNVIFDLLHGEAASIPARDALAEASATTGLAICPAVYAEVAVAFAEPSDLDALLSELGIHVDPFSDRALWEASRAWLAYLRGRPPEVSCPRCGTGFKIACPGCGSAVSWRQHLVTDFLIGGHAAANAGCLLTRDRGYFRTYFPGLRLINPEGRE